MKNATLQINGKKGSAAHGIQYTIIKEGFGVEYVYLTASRFKPLEPLLFGIAQAINNRGLKFDTYMIFGRPLTITLDRQYFNFVELKK